MICWSFLTAWQKPVSGPPVCGNDGESTHVSFTGERRTSSICVLRKRTPLTSRARRGHVPRPRSNATLELSELHSPLHNRPCLRSLRMCCTLEEPSGTLMEIQLLSISFPPCLD